MPQVGGDLHLSPTQCGRADDCARPGSDDGEAADGDVNEPSAVGRAPIHGFDDEFGEGVEDGSGTASTPTEFDPLAAELRATEGGVAECHLAEVDLGGSHCEPGLIQYQPTGGSAVRALPSDLFLGDAQRLQLADEFEHGQSTEPGAGAEFLPGDGPLSLDRAQD